VEHLLTDMGLRIAGLRKELGLTQEELAERAGITSQTVSTAELGKKALRPENIVKISRALGVSTDYLLTGYKNSKDSVDVNEKLHSASPDKYDQVMRVIDILLEDH